MAFLIKLSLWALAFVPLIVNTSVFFPFIFGKTLMIRIFISLVSLLFAVHLVANEGFRREIYGKAKRIAKNPVFIATSAFIAIFAISTIFAVNPFRAFFGDVERGEGLLGFLYFYAFFVYSLFLFEKKDWIMFFKLNLITGFFLFTKQLFELCPTSDAGVTVCNWGARPGAFTGNPAFLGGYFLFVIFAALIALYYSRKDVIWKWFSGLMIPVATIGLFITQTRSAMVGLIVGLLALVVYGFFNGREIIVRNGVSLRKASLWLLIAMLLVGGIFIATKNNPVWQSVPGFNRATHFTFMDATVQTRLISLGVSKNAIDPAQNGVQKFLVGWGPENFSIAYNQYYNPEYYKYEHTWFDRAHNKLMDVTVMNGILGLLSYLAIWFLVGWTVFKRKGFSFDMMATLFFAVAFFFNLLFVFDQVSTIIPFFAFLGFAITVSALEQKDEQASGKNKARTSEAIDTKDQVSFGIAGAVSLFFVWGLIFWTVVPMSQMTNYLSAVSEGKLAVIMQQPDAIFEPYTFVQQDIRTHLLNATSANLGNAQLKPLLELALAKMEELVQKEPTNPRHLLILGGAYERLGKTNGDAALIQKAEAYYQQAFKLAPMRQDIVHVLALSYSYQGRMEEGIALLRKSLETDSISPETHYYLGVLLTTTSDYKESFYELEKAMTSPVLASGKNETTINSYGYLLRRAYQDRDEELFIAIAKRIEMLDPELGVQIGQVRAYVEQGIWPQVNFN